MRNKGNAVIWVLLVIIALGIVGMKLSDDFKKHFNNGHALYNQKDLKGAVTEWEACAKINPWSKRTAYNLGLAYCEQVFETRKNTYNFSGYTPEQMELFNKAELCLIKAIKLDPYYEDPVINLSSLYSHLAESTNNVEYARKGIQVLEKAIKSKPDNESMMKQLEILKQQESGLR